MLAVLLGSPVALALNPLLDISQHGHRAWRNLDGYGLGTVIAIAQTTDGYMWLATPTELLRFDGVRRVPVRLASGDPFDEASRALKGARDGRLWIGTTRGLLVYGDGAVQTQALMAGVTVNAIDEATDGTIWAAGTAQGKGMLCAISQRGTECHGQDGRLGAEIVALHRDSRNQLWVVGVERVWKWGSEPLASFPLPARADVVRSVAEMPDGAIVIGLRGQVARIAEDRIETLELPRWTRDLAFDKALRDRDGSLWLGTADTGLMRLHAGRLDAYASTDGLSGDKILDLFEDREGNVWVSTSRGLDQFRPVAPARQSGLNGLKGRARAVLSARDGSVWASTTTGVYRLERPHTWKLHSSWLAGVGSLFEDHRGRIWTPSQQGVRYFDGKRFVAPIGIPSGPIDAMAESADGELWLAHRDLGLLRVRSEGGNRFFAISMLRPSSRVSALAVDPIDQSLWVGLWSGGLERIRDGKPMPGPTLAENATLPSPVTHLQTSPDGNLWVSTFAGMFRLANGRAVRLDPGHGPVCDRIFSSFLDETSLWLNTQCGLIRADLANARATALDNGVRQTLPSQLIDIWDGVDQGIAGRSVGSINPSYNFIPKLVQASDGRPWVVTGDSLVTIDPRWIPPQGLTPPTYIEKLISDGKTYDKRASVRLPPLQQNLEVQYTGLNFSAPERVQFRYRLEGRDSEWQHAGSRRQAFYTDLAPGTYRFRVHAANLDGVWNETGDSIAFTIEPAWYQTRWFHAAVLLALCALLFTIYRVRMAQVTARVHSRMEAQLGERERIARELHDTLLQGVQGLILRFQAAADRMSPSEPARPLIAQSLDRAERLLVESRDKVRNLRPSARSTATLAEMLAAEGAQFDAPESADPVQFRVMAQGVPRNLHPIVREEGFAIAREAIANAFQHAQAKSIEVETVYGEAALFVRIRDDGLGIAKDVLDAGGRPGHFGLLGMRERAERLGATVEVFSRTGAGTEISLRVPATVAYASASASSRRRGETMGFDKAI